jgi:hypothetical protein
VSHQDSSTKATYGLSKREQPPHANLHEATHFSPLCAIPVRSLLVLQLRLTSRNDNFHGMGETA